MFEDIFCNKKPIPQKLLQYGFRSCQNNLFYTVDIMDGEFTLTVTIDGDGNTDTTLVEAYSNEEYILYKTSAEGKFVNEVREAITAVLEDIAWNCSNTDVFKQNQTLHLIDHVLEVYGDETEYLWPDTPDNGIWRRKDTNKWYGAILTVEWKRLGIDSDRKIEILNLKAKPEDIEKLLERDSIFPAWHMNKKHWFTVILDNSIPNEELYTLIEESRRLVGKKK